MNPNSFDCISEAVWKRKVEQHLLRLAGDVSLIQKRQPQRPGEWQGLWPHAEDAFEGITGGGASSDSGLPLQGFLATDLDAPENPEGPPTTADMDVYQPVSGVLVYTHTIEVKNYDLSLSALAGTYCKSEWINGERQLYWVACEPSLLTLDDTDGGMLLDTDGEQILINL